jgi:hypothetical protein
MRANSSEAPPAFIKSFLLLLAFDIDWCVFDMTLSLPASSRRRIVDGSAEGVRRKARDDGAKASEAGSAASMQHTVAALNLMVHCKEGGSFCCCYCGLNNERVELK